MLYMAWMDDNPQAAVNAPVNHPLESHIASVVKDDIPLVPTDDVAPVSPTVNKIMVSKNIISVTTDVMRLSIDLEGGDIVKLSLPKYPIELNGNAGFQLLDQSMSRSYIAQSGLLSVFGPDSATSGRATFTSSSREYEMLDTAKNLIVKLNYTTPTNVKIIKQFVFTRDSYDVEVIYKINNQGTRDYTARFYGRLKRDAGEESGGFLSGMQTYTGAAVNTPDKAYKKLKFGDFAKKPFSQTISGGWLAMSEQYFVSSWIANPKQKYYYQTETFANNLYGISLISDSLTVAPGTTADIGAKLYAGPEITDDLKELSNGLELTVDYGFLWPICQPIFWLLKKLYSFVGNWGWAIICITITIKALFYKLSAASYRSMGNMRKLQPQMEALKREHGDDKQKFGQEMMQLYRREKVNPLGGCLPVLVQIPVFISLYYVLLGSVELRQAPFALWIYDLSIKDPFYVLPLLMGATMFLQQKLNPAPPDPVQAKIMMAMPFVFTVIFLQFPAGLVLYWLVNNMLSITQQWYITNKVLGCKR